jgi:hypothetical protein
MAPVESHSRLHGTLPPVVRPSLHPIRQKPLRSEGAPELSGNARSAGAAPTKFKSQMNNDLVFVALAVAFFVLSAAYAHFCNKVR